MGNGLPIAAETFGRNLMQTVYDFVTIVCFICVVVTYFMFTEGGMKILAHFMLPAAAFAIANQVGNHAGSDVLMNILAVVLIVAGIGYTFIVSIVPLDAERAAALCVRFPPPEGAGGRGASPLERSTEPVLRSL